MMMPQNNCFRRILKNRRGDILFTLFALGFMIAIITFYIASTLFGPKFFTKYIGEVSDGIVKASHQAEQAMIYIDESARYASLQSVYSLGDKGGFAYDPPCGKYNGYAVWLDKGKGDDCMPANEIKANLAKEINRNLASYITNYPSKDVFIPFNYDFEFAKRGDALEIVGKTNEKLEILVLKDKSKESAELFAGDLKVYSKIGLEWSVPIDPRYVPKDSNGKPRWDPFEHPYDKSRYNPSIYSKDPRGNPYRFKGIHTGIDIYATSDGVPVMSVADGEVIKVASCVYISHKGKGSDSDKEYTSVYCHVKGDTSLLGKEVKRGQKIGTIYYPSVPHLHMEIYSKRNTEGSPSNKFSDCGCSSDSDCEARCPSASSCSSELVNTGCYIREKDKYLINPIDIISY